ncbi:TRAP transporter small permease [Seohaeicola saemankumensis]|nr:TRAP transporter small permease subunit [Seohaeicola saemankumensis]MCA0873242.1 TRAP transporter small permease [Seohaeicola saemankumensis]
MLNLITRLARLTAIVGGLVLVALVVLTCVSVLGRGLNTVGHSDLLQALSQGAADALLATGVAPVNGDFELVEAGIAFAVFSFLPICQLYGAHATVDVFTSVLPVRVNKWIMAFWEIVLTALVLLITWRLFAGMQSKMAYGETTFLLQFPVWWAYAASFAAACVASLVSLYCAAARLGEAITGRALMPYSEGSSH